MTLHRTMYVTDNPINLVDKYGFESITLDNGQTVEIPNGIKLDFSFLSSASSFGNQKANQLVLVGTQNSPLQKSLNGGSLGYIDQCGNFVSGSKPTGLYIDSCGNLADPNYTPPQVRTLTYEELVQRDIESAKYVKRVTKLLSTTSDFIPIYGEVDSLIKGLGTDWLTDTLTGSHDKLNSTERTGGWLGAIPLFGRFSKLPKVTKMLGPTLTAGIDAASNIPKTIYNTYQITTTQEPEQKALNIIDTGKGIREIGDALDKIRLIIRITIYWK